MDDLFDRFAEWLNEGAADFGDPPMGVQIPENDASDKEIAEYVQKVEEESMNREDDDDMTQWPMKDDAPMEAVRAYIEFLRIRMDAMDNHMTID